MPDFLHVPLSDIDEPEMPIREAMDEHKLRELADSMAAIGLQQPVLLVTRGMRYEIVAGHRRYMAARSLHWMNIPAIVHKPEEIKVEAALLAENLYREDINAGEEAIWYAQLLEKFKLDEAGLCKLVHQSADYIADRLRLLRQDRQVLDAIRQRQIIFSVGRELNKIDDEGMRRYYLAQAIASGASARVVSSWVTSWKANSAPLPEPGNTSSEPLPAPVIEPYKICCALCGGDRDPYNLETVMIHKWEWEHIQKQLKQLAEA